MNSRDTRIITELKTIARDVSPVGRSKHAAAIVHRNDIISIGVNSTKTHPFQQKYGRNSESIFLHAEVSAIHNALKHLRVDELSRCHLYVVRVKKINNLFVSSLSRPCEGCLRCILDFGLKSVIFTTDDTHHIERITT